MAIIEINWKPARSELRIFGFGLALFCAVIAVWLFLKGGHSAWITGLLFTFAVLAALVSVIVPERLRAVYWVLMVLAFPIGWVMSHAIFAVVFYFVFTPIGILFRLRGRDPMQRRFDPHAKTYWEPHKSKDSPEDYFRQF